MTEDMRGLFIIIKGTYTHNKGPTFINPHTESQNWLGGYNPYDPDTEEWYICIDRITHTCMAGGSDFNKVLGAVYRCITKYKTLANYLKMVEQLAGERFYDEKKDKVLHKSGTSSMMRELYKELDSRWGDFYEPEIKRQEDLAYEFLKENQPFRKAQKKLKRVGVEKVTMTPVKKVGETETPKHLGKVHPKKAKSIKRLSMA